MQLCDYSQCTGCMSCVNACPMNCITMHWEENTIDYPQIVQADCIQCGKCTKACPVLTERYLPDRLEHAELYAAAINVPKDLKKSSSGGIAYALGLNILQQHGVVYGAAYNKKLQVEHIEADTVEQLSRTQGSKYVQSYIGFSFQQVRKQLQSGRKVLFVGQPCQVAGLYQFLAKDDPNLITCDLLCGGSTSPRIFAKYLKYIKEHYHVNLVDYNFRDKSYGYGYLCTTTTTTTGKVIRLNGSAGSFITMLGAGYGRESCFSCPYTSMKRVGDFSLGDCYDSSSYLYKEGMSLVMVNSIKGKEMLASIEPVVKFDCNIPVKEYTKKVTVLHGPKYAPEDYRDFIQTASSLSWKQIHKKYIWEHMGFKNKVMSSCPMCVRVFISKVYRRIKNHDEE